MTLIWLKTEKLIKKTPPTKVENPLVPIFDLNQIWIPIFNLNQNMKNKKIVELISFHATDLSKDAFDLLYIYIKCFAKDLNLGKMIK